MITMRPRIHPIRLDVGSIALLAAISLAFPSSLKAQAVDLRRAVEELAGQLGERVEQGQTITIAVADFPDLSGNISNLGRFVAERLTTELSLQPDRFQVIERRRLVSVIEELKLSTSELVDPEHVREVGRMLGAEALVTGSLSNLGTVVDIDARVILIESLRVFPGARVSVSKDRVVEDLLAAGVSPSRPIKGDRARGPGDESPLIFREKRFEMEALGAELIGGEIRVTLTYMSREKNPRRHSFSPSRHFVVDDSGNRYHGVDTSFGRSRTFVEAVPERFWISFGQVLIEPVSVSVSLQWSFGVVDHVWATLRDIPVSSKP